MLKAREAVCNLPTYHPPLAGRTGLRLDFNENTVGCSPRVLERLRRIEAEDLARYPEREPVESVAASYLKVSPQELLLTNGVDEAIHLLCQTYLEANDEAFIVVPTFSMYQIFAAATGAHVVQIPAEKDFTFPRAAILRRLTPKTRVIALANPNNPTGSVASAEDILRIAGSTPQAAILVDEAYFEFHGQSLLGKWREHPNLFLARTFSKAYGLAGLRVGVLLGSVEQISAVRRVASPYNVNSVALICLPAALDDREYVHQYVQEVRAGRERVQRELTALGIPFWPSQANFVLIELGDRHAAFVQRMREHGILVRDRSRDPGCEGCVRITLGSAEHTDRLLRALGETLAAIGARRQEVSR
jgi:histidinol-phosphate aminotransferase